MIINKLIKGMVDRSNLSVDEISVETGCTVEIIRTVLDGTAVTARMAFEICDAIGVRLEDILRAY